MNKQHYHLVHQIDTKITHCMYKINLDDLVEEEQGAYSEKRMSAIKTSNFG